MSEKARVECDYNYGPSPQPLPHGGGAINELKQQSEMLKEARKRRKKEEKKEKEERRRR